MHHFEGGQRKPTSINDLERVPPLTVLASYQQYDVVVHEVSHILAELQALGIDDGMHMYLFGSAARCKLRTIVEDPHDPSDIDVLVIVSEASITKMNGMRGDPRYGLGWSDTNDVTSFRLKRSSVTGMLADTEVYIYAASGLAKQLQTEAIWQQRAPDGSPGFYTQAVRDALDVAK